MTSAEIAIGRGASLRAPRVGRAKIVFIWMGLTLLAFPLAGFLGWGVAGHVDAAVPAMLAGALTGAGVGFAQWLFLRRDLQVGPIWILVTAVALAAGLSVGAAAVGYETSARSLAIMGAISGAPVGLAQGLVLRNRFSLWAAWMVAMPVIWAMAWVASASVIDATNQFPVFGASGCIPFGFVSGLLMMAGRRIEPDTR
jgi:hypothetical protein